MENDKGSYSWWWDSHNSPQHSHWLQSILSDLDQKTKAMLTLIQEDGDSFAQRAEMYYKKRPELVKMVEEFHRSYRSLAERYDLLKSELTHVHSSSSSSSNSLKLLQNPHNTGKKVMGSSVDSKLELSNSNPESVVEDPDLECNTHSSHLELPNKTTVTLKRGQLNLNLISDHPIQNSGKQNIEIGINSMETEVDDPKSNGFELGHEIVKDYDEGKFFERESKWPDLRFQVSRLMEDNLKQQEELIRRNDEKREAIRELCTQLEKLMEENRSLQMYVRDSKVYNKQNTSQILRFKGLFKFLGGSA